eukprot:GILK01007706.1.p1 GENE.GILK01007706.1~~GILK01007706.1.p1  ORF type:complete len:350 (+),score=23.70 GILK01007706.1:33-1082(+)
MESTVVRCRVLEKWEKSVMVANQRRVFTLFAKPEILADLVEYQDYEFTVNGRKILHVRQQPLRVLYSIGAILTADNKILMLQNRNSTKFIDFKYKLIDFTSKRMRGQVYDQQLQACIRCLDSTSEWLSAEFDAVKNLGENRELERVFRKHDLEPFSCDDLKDSLVVMFQNASDQFTTMTPPSVDHDACLYSLPKGKSKHKHEDWKNTARREAVEELSRFVPEAMRKSFTFKFNHAWNSSESRDLTFGCSTRNLKMPLFVYDATSWDCLELLTITKLDLYEHEGEFRSFSFYPVDEVFKMDNGMWAQDTANSTALSKALLNGPRRDMSYASRGGRAFRGNNRASSRSSIL